MSSDSNGFVDQVGRGLGRLFKFLLRLLFVLVLAVALGAGIFYGISAGLPALDRAYIQPVRDNTAAIAALKAKATQTAESYTAQIETLQTRITALEVSGDGRSEAMALVETRLATLSPLVEAQADLESRLEAIDTALEDLDAALAALETAGDARLDALEEDLGAQSETIEALNAAQAEDPYPGETLHGELQLLKIMTLLTRAQVYLAGEAVETAAADLLSAREITAGLIDEDRETGADLEALLLRIDLALENLPDRPDLALADLTAAWEDLLTAISPAVTIDETDAETAAGTPTPTPGPTATP